MRLNAGLRRSEIAAQCVFVEDSEGELLDAGFKLFYSIYTTCALTSDVIEYKSNSTIHVVVFLSISSQVRRDSVGVEEELRTAVSYLKNFFVV